MKEADNTGAKYVLRPKCRRRRSSRGGYKATLGSWPSGQRDRRAAGEAGGVEEGDRWAVSAVESKGEGGCSRCSNRHKKRLSTERRVPVTDEADNIVDGVAEEGLDAKALVLEMEWRREVWTLRRRCGGG